MFAKIAAKRRGFTLIELLVVIVIIAVLALIAIPRFVDAGTRSREASLKSNLSLLRAAIATYYTDTGAYPATLNDLIVIAAPASGLSSTAAVTNITSTDWHGPYIQGTVLPPDPMMPIGTQFKYSIASGTVGAVSSTSTANGLDNKPYSGY